jgi:hypothetical protein
MAENAQDVFDELWNRYKMACSDFELEIGQGCPRGPRGLSGDDMTIRQRFSKALKAETEVQKSCPCCHSAMRNKIVGKIVAYNDYNFCPMCGRRLEEK